MKTKLLIFTYHQFGLLIDSLKYCQFAKDKYDITYLGWDYGRPKIHMEGVTVKYVSRAGSIFKRNIRLLYRLHREIRSGVYDVVFMHYTRGISFVRIFNLQQITIFDIRTLSVDRSKITRVIYNSCLKFESLFFINHSVITAKIAKQLRLKKYSILPLGADTMPINRKKKTVNDFNLLYVGTLENRDIIKCVKGFHKYINLTEDKYIKLIIIGDSSGSELIDIKSYIKKFSILDKRVICLGKVPHNQLEKYFNESDVGISFIPVTDWYTHQPPTKTYEYLLSGLPIIATNTSENKKILNNEEMCVLINDSIEDFTEAIFLIKRKIESNTSSSLSLSKKYLKFSWSQIVKDSFVSIIQNAK